MSSITDAILQENEALFNLLGPNRFTDSLSGNSTTQETAESRIIEPAQWVGAGALDGIDLFAATIRPPVVVTSLPTLPDTAYGAGSFVFLTTDAKLYRNTDGSTWSVAVDGGDIVASSITAGSIAAGAIGADQLAATIILASTIETSAGADRVVIDGTGLRSYSGDVLTGEWDKSGITAQSLRIGNLAGGHNVVLNSSFEGGAYVTGSTTITFTDTTNYWKAANRTTALDNISEGTSLTATTVAF